MPMSSTARMTSNGQRSLNVTTAGDPQLPTRRRTGPPRCPGPQESLRNS